MASVDNFGQSPRSIDRKDMPVFSPLSTLPDEILMKILDFALMTDEPLDLEATIDLSRKDPLVKDYKQHMIEPISSEEFLESFPSSFGPEPGMSLEIHLLPSWHRVHFKDWLIVNGTCSRFRRLGREYYWKNRQCIVTPGVLKKLDKADASSSPLAKPFAHPLLLDHVQDIVIINLNVQSASKFILLPRLLASFPNLKACTLVIDYKADQKLDHIKNRKLLPPGEVGDKGPTSLMKSLMLGLGMNEKINLMIGISQPDERPKHWAEESLKSNVFPMLELRRTWMMSAKRPAEPKDRATGAGTPV
ncbi:hypothetical protein BGZ63DRAFT_379057 [Mariannaea sp. PMI_226]|nr:hypothetical protein BGZ63DRAFT_379057 [Mariannaea sp. PMI_226]